MKLLIDTTTKYVSIITFEENDIIDCIQYEGNNDHTTSIYEHLAKMNMQSIDAIYVTSGPGSYTGVRIGVLVAKTLAHELKTSLFAINTLKLFYAGYRCDVLLDARGKKYFKFNGESFSQIGYDDVTSERIIDGYINKEWLIDKQILSQFTEVDPLQLQIEYLKDAI